MSLYKTVVLAFTGLVLLGAVALSLHSIGTDVPAAVNIDNLPTIIIDPGHGGIDGGAVGVGGIVEKDLNLEISLTLRDMFRMMGFEVIMTRDTDISIHDEGVTGVRRQKTSDLRNRLAICDAYPGAIFLSIHQNKFGDSSSKGAQVFYGANDPDSKALAEILQKNISASLQPGNKRIVKKAGKNLFLMVQAKCPAVLVECGFVSNASEVKRLKDPEYRSQLAFAIFASTLEYLQQSDAPPPPTAEHDRDVQ